MLGNATSQPRIPSGFCCVGSASVRGRAFVRARRNAGERGPHSWRDAGGRPSLVSRLAGRRPPGLEGRWPCGAQATRLEAPQLARVEAALLKGPGAHGFATELWTLPRVATLLEQLTRVRYHPGHVWYILRRLGWSLQRPTRHARERDEAAIAEWKRRRWPQVKKTPGGAGAGSSSKTKAASRTGRSSAAPGPRAATRRS